MQLLKDAILVTACTKRKTPLKNQALSPACVPRGPIGSVADTWVQLLARATPEKSAGDTYRGVVPSLGRSAEALGVRWFIVSAGIGLVGARTTIPAYDCTVSASGESILARITSPDRPTGSDWWSALTRSLGTTTPLRSAIEQTGGGLACIALADNYWRMVEAEFQGLTAAASKRLRIFRAPGLSPLAPDLDAQVMPYDDRLDGENSAIRGTRGSFAARAAHHFITEIAPRSPKGSAVEHAELVKRALVGWHKPSLVARRAVTDSEIKKLIRGMRGDGVVTATSQLRHLRAVKQIACEQSRFKRLFSEVVGE